jgi:hypothetical protein
MWSGMKIACTSPPLADSRDQASLHRVGLNLPATWLPTSPDIKNRSKRLTETLFDWSAIGAAQPCPFPTFENDLELSVRNCLQMRDP